MAKSEDPPSPVEAYSSSSNATPVGEMAAPTAAPSGYYGVPGTPVSQVKAAKPFDDWTVFSIVALFMDIVGLSPVGIVMGHVALYKLKRNGQAGRGFAIAALVVGYVFFVITVALIVVWAIFVFSAVSEANDVSTIGGSFG